jgi:conjugal transfer pilus assembly protein TraE
MKLERYINKSSNLYAENRLLKFAVVCIGIAVVVSGFFSYIAMQYQKVIILPPVVDRRVVITGNKVDENYFKLFTRYAMTLLNNHTAATAQSQFNEFLTLVTTSAYPEMEKTLSALADTIKELNMTSVYYPQKIKVNEETRVIEVTGLQKKFASTTLVESGPKKYIIKYVIINGRFYIDDIKEEVVKN